MSSGIPRRGQRSIGKKTKTNADKAKAIGSENNKGKIREFCYIAFIPITLLNHQVDKIIFLKKLEIEITPVMEKK